MTIAIPADIKVTAEVHKRHANQRPAPGEYRVIAFTDDLEPLIIDYARGLMVVREPHTLWTEPLPTVLPAPPGWRITDGEWSKPIIAMSVADDFYADDVAVWWHGDEGLSPMRLREQQAGWNPVLRDADGEVVYTWPTDPPADSRS